MFIGLVPLFMADENLRNEYGKAKRAKIFWYAFNAFLIWNICTTWWVLNTSFLPGIVANLANTALFATVFVIFHQARTVLRERVQPYVFTALWIAFEYLHMQWEISWPWLTFGNALAEYPACIQWYEFTGVFGGSAWIILANYWIYQWWRSARRSKGALVRILIWILVPIGWSLWRYYTYPLAQGDIEVVAVQPNFEPHYEKFSIPQREQLTRFIDLSRSALTDSTDYLVFPETSFDLVRLGHLDNDYRIQALRTLLNEYPNLHIVSGLESFRVHEEKSDLSSMREMTNRNGEVFYFDVQNSAIQLDNEGAPEVYFKSKLVPGAEHFPFRDFLPFLKPIVDMLQGSIAGLTTQESRVVFHSDAGDVAPVICYESVYGEYVGEYIRKGAGIIFIVTNDGWWDRTPGHIQHLKFGALRAVEHRRPIARSANTGISCFINQRGDILQPTRYRETVAIRGKLDPGKTLTFYTQWGDIIARVAIFLAVLFIALTITRSIVPEKASAKPESPEN